MLGTNPIRKIDLHRDGSLFVHSIFMTVQGEGPFAGYPAVFLRLGGCSLACAFCDTEFDEGAERFECEEIIRRILKIAAPRCKLLVITGGEPMRQELSPLAQRIIRMGWHVQIETAGIHPIGLLTEFVLNRQVSIVCSPKTGRLDSEIFGFATCFKYIIDYRWDLSEQDGLPLMGAPMGRHRTRAELARPRASAPVYLQPLDDPRDEGAREKNSFLCASLAIKHGYRVSIQTHKIMGVA